jgi:hypothetical protein
VVATLRSDPTIPLPEWAIHYTLESALETLPLGRAGGELFTAIVEDFQSPGMPDAYGERLDPLSWYWRRLTAETREALQLAYEEELRRWQRAGHMVIGGCGPTGAR